MGNELQDLVERVEAADGWDRELDSAIALLMKADTIPLHELGNPNWRDPRPLMSNASNAQLTPPFTASIDAALTLVPEGWGWNAISPNSKARASGILRSDAPCQAEVQFGCEQRFIVAAATPALALCAAALKAHTSA